ncbi:MAG: ribose-phosphate pyrophosphokinase (PRPS, prsA) [Candidatus Hecatellales archaeon B24]|nr:MAG: ribose-phosphate pyrophosphokinase (PRPS, prsA) [Candidatus Hecatellales archaeon B24]
MLVVGGPASAELARKVAQLVGCRFVEVEARKFPDGESYVRLTREVKDEKTVIVQSTYPPQDTHLLQLLLLVDAATRSRASEVTAVVPYMAYARQDKVFRPNEPVSAEVVLKVLRELGTRRIVTVDVHSPEVFSRVAMEHVNLSAIGILARHFLDLGFKGVSAFAPDRKAARMAEEASKILGGSYGWFSKQRDRVTGEVSMMLERGEAEGREIVIFDDIISSGGTVMMAARTLKKAGARRVYAACTHALTSRESYMKILSSGVEDIVSTDTIPTFTSKVSVAGLLAETLRSLL